MHFAVVLNATPGFGFQGGPSFQTKIYALQNGREARNGEWSIARHRYRAPYSNITDDALDLIRSAWLTCRGRLHSFLFKDWMDFRAIDADFGVGDGSATRFVLRKVSTFGVGSYERLIREPVPGFTVRVNGITTPVAFDEAAREVVFAEPPASGAALSWTGEFLVRVRFDMDDLDFSVDNRSGDSYVHNGTIDLVEVFE